MERSNTHVHLNRISQILNFELASTVLFVFSFMHSIFLIVAIIAAFLFIPYLLYVLFKERRFGWIASLVTVIFAPLVISIPFGITSEYLSIILMVSLLLFYFYCFVIKMSIREWIRTYNWTQQLEEQKREMKNNQQNLSITEFIK